MNSPAPSNWKPAPVTGRLSHIDALRGIAVILMIQQHMLAWLWNAPRLTFPDLVRAYPLSMGMNLLGNLAAPLFVTLAGMGAGLFLDRPGARARTLVMRGACIMLLGLALNLLAPYWFNPGTWYVLNLIGLCLMISPALVRSPSLLLGALCMGAFVATPLVQTWLSTPIYLPEVRLNDTSFPGGVVRLAMAEGHFPVLPWMALFILGIIAHRLAKPEKPACALAPAAGLIAAGATLALLYRHGYAFATYGPLYRAFVFAPYFFPPHPPLMLVLAGMALAFMTAARLIRREDGGIIIRVLSRFGRASITLLFVHAMLFNTLGHATGLYRSFSITGSWLIIAGFLLAAAVALAPWSRSGFDYGLEWLVRLPERSLVREWRISLKSD
jgi:uncharacterized membrane protein